MQKISNEDRQRIIAESRETLRRVDAMLDDRRMAAFDDDRGVSADTTPQETDAHVRYEPRNERHRREISEQEERFARERARREHRLDTPPITAADVEMRIDVALRAERQTVIPALRAAVDELLAQERKHIQSEMAQQMRALELQVAKLESALSALQVALVAERGKATDLPNPLTRMN